MGFLGWTELLGSLAPLQPVHSALDSDIVEQNMHLLPHLSVASVYWGFGISEGDQQT